MLLTDHARRANRRQALSQPAWRRRHPRRRPSEFRRRRLGDGVLAAQEDYTETGAFPELFAIYVGHWKRRIRIYDRDTHRELVVKWFEGSEPI